MEKKKKKDSEKFIASSLQFPPFLENYFPRRFIPVLNFTRKTSLHQNLLSNLSQDKKWLNTDFVVFSGAISHCLLDMVVVNSKESYCHGIMQAMNRLRLEGRLCDVSLVVGDETIAAHRCVLVAGSDYFKSRFIGPFKADTLPQVDLSSITSDVAAVELMLNFLYTGEVTIDRRNLEPILKVSSFFMISELRDLCTDFMEKNLNLNTCLKYFLLSVDHMIPEIENKIEQTVKSRFHDYLIFEDQSLEVTPDQLLYLIQNCQVFENCTNEDILVYLYHWVGSGKSEAYELLGCDILELVCSRERKVQIDNDSNRKSSESFEKLKHAVDCDESKSVFKNKLKRIIAKCFTKSKSETKVLRPLTSRSPNPSKSGNMQSNTESILITISPKLRILEITEKEDIHNTEHNLQEGQAVFDLCVYIPRTRSWHYLHEGLLKDVFEQICFEDIDWMYCLTRDKLCCVFPYEENVNMLHLNDLTWTSIDYQQIEPSDNDLEMSCHDYCVCADNQILYLLLRVNVFANEDHEDVVQTYFKCFRLTPENTWTFTFSTPRINTDDQFGTFAATVSSKSNEMMILYQSSDQLHVFIAEMHSETTANPTVHYFTGRDNVLGDELHILQNRDHFFVMMVSFSHEDSAKITCSFKYKFQSKQLVPVMDTYLVVDDKVFQYSESKRYPCAYSYSACDKNCLWLFGGTKEHGSSLIEVNIDNKGKLTSYSHKPPPFSCVTAVVAGTIHNACLMSLKTITKYLSD